MIGLGSDLVKSDNLDRAQWVALIDREGHPTGIVSLGDLARNGHEDLAARVIISISQSVPAISGSPWLR